MIFSMFGGKDSDVKDRQIKGYLGAGVVVFIVGLLVGLLLSCVMDSFEGMSGYNPGWSKYDSDIRIGVDPRNLTQREMTNIQQSKRRYGSKYPTNCSIDMDDWTPGVNRPVLSRLECDKALRSDELNECLNNYNNVKVEEMDTVNDDEDCVTARDKQDFVFQQFGNDGTVIDPKSNPLFNPAPPILRPSKR